MNAIRIMDKLLWPTSKSASLAKQLPIVDSTDDLLIFDESCSREDILDIVNPANQATYQLLKLKAAPESVCEFLTDSGRCYIRDSDQ